MGRLRDAVVMLVVACAVSGLGLAAGGEDHPGQPINRVFHGPGGMFAIAIDLEVREPGGQVPQKATVKEADRPAPAKGEPVPKKDVAQKRAADRKAAQKKAEEDALEAQAAQYVPQLWPMFRAEYYFIRNACDLDKGQRLAVARLGAEAAKKAARGFVEAQQKMMRGGWRPGMDQPNPRRIMEAELRKSVSPLLTPQQRSRYEQEVDRRAAGLKQMIIDNLVAKLDGDLVLTADQRTKVAEGIAANWKDSWGQSIEMLQNIDNFFPDVPEKAVMPYLTENQKVAWRRIPRNSGVFWGISFNGIVQENDPLDDPELLQAQKESAEKQGQGQPQAAPAAGVIFRVR
ncbi:hypothetical protein [Aquisphaera insulae]|uniref:hypothetical protein n=1 Tax=Aquisphaera insulae TaxID=2712864 RepID=UPI0013ECDB52|nr:hypothetical protein [Aquisphaera insulae]